MKIKPKKYADILYKLILEKKPTKIKEVVAFFADYLRSKQALHFEQQIIDEFSKIYNKENNIVTVEATTMDGLSVVDKNETILQLKNLLSREVELQEKVDSSLLGGMIIRWEDNVIDGSIATKINRLKNSLK